jgi:pimeloyl-ACP methyl ester carboxylesterase
MTVNVRARDGGALLRDSEFRLRDGRRLAYCEYGARDGVPAFFFHGWPGSRLNFAPNHAAAADAGVRGVAVD